MIKKITQIIRRKYFPSELEKSAKKWFADDGDFFHRLNYDELKSDSIVIDLGGYKGQWASDIYSKYLCKIYVFEPVNQFYKLITDRFKRNSNIKVFHFGLGTIDKQDTIYISKDSSSTHRTFGTTEKIFIRNMASFLSEHSISKIDLLKINIEGGEYDLLDYLIENRLILAIRNIQVQFHNFIPNASSMMETLQNKLSYTHELTYHYRFIWENWRLKNTL